MLRHRSQVAVATAVAMSVAMAGAAWWRGAAIDLRNAQRASQSLAEDVVSAEAALGAAVVSPVGRTAEWSVAADWQERVQNQMKMDGIALSTRTLADSYLRRYAEERDERTLARGNRGSVGHDGDQLQPGQLVANGSPDARDILEERLRP